MLEGPTVSFVRDDLGDGTPHWVAETTDGVVIELSGIPSDDPEFHFIRQMTILLPLDGEVSDASSEVLRSFLLAADLLTESQAREWILSALDQWTGGTLDASRDILVNTVGYDEPDQITMSVEVLDLLGVLVISLESTDQP